MWAEIPPINGVPKMREVGLSDEFLRHHLKSSEKNNDMMACPRQARSCL